MTKTNYKNWTLIDWDGNPALKLTCWRKSFRHGHVSVGVGEFTLIVYSYGADSDDSISSTRWNAPPAKALTELEAMRMVDSNKGLCTVWHTHTHRRHV